MPRCAGWVRALPDHRLLDRLIGGRLWIVLIGTLLVGLVTLQLSLLKLNAGIGDAVQKSAQLEEQNRALRITNSQLSDSERVVAEATKMGLVMPPQGSPRFLHASGADAGNAMRTMRAPDAAAVAAAAAAAGAADAVTGDDSATTDGSTTADGSTSDTTSADGSAVAGVSGTADSSDTGGTTDTTDAGAAGTTAGTDTGTADTTGTGTDTSGAATTGATGSDTTGAATGTDTSDSADATAGGGAPIG